MLFSLAFVAASLIARSVVAEDAPKDIVISKFDNAAEMNNWEAWFGDLSPKVTFDPAVDAEGKTNSGALKVVVKFDQAAPSDNQFSLRAALSGDGALDAKVVDGAQYLNVQLDFLCATNSAIRASGDMGVLDVGLVATDFSQVWFPGYTVSKKEGWQHLNLKLKAPAPPTGDLAHIGGVVIKMWADDPKWGLTGTSTFWVDNVKVIATPAPKKEVTSSQ